MEKSNHYTIQLECYMVELYMDKLIDLMPNNSGQKPPKLEIREDPTTGLVSILNVTMHTVNALKEAFDIYKMGI